MRCFGILGLAVIFFSIPVRGQDQGIPPQAKVYSGGFGAGLAMTNGNSDTRNFNLSFELTRDPKSRSLTKINGLYLRSSAGGEAISDLLRLGFREDYLLSKRIGIFGALGYLRDPFKDISYLINPQGGVDLKVYTSEKASFSVNAGAGSVWEKDHGLDVHTSGTVNVGQSYSLKISENAKFTQNLTGLWKTSNLSDALYHFDLALTTTIVKGVDLKLEFMDEYKNVTPNLEVKKNDSALIASFVFKF